MTTPVLTAARATGVRDRIAVRGVTTAALAAAASCFTILGWSGLAVDPGGFVRPLALLAVGVAVVGVVLRTVGAPRPVVVLVQVLGVAGVLHAWWSAAGAVGGWVPTPTSLAEVADTLSRSVDAAQKWQAPVPSRVVAFDPLMVAIGSAVVVLVDAYAVTYRRAVVAGLPLLAAFTLPAAVTGGMRWDHFVLAASAYLLLVAAEQLADLSRWGRAVVGVPTQGREDHEPASPSTLALLHRNRPALLRVLAPSLLLAVAGSFLVPEEIGILGGGGGGGSGAGEVKIENPMTDLRRDLVLGPDLDLITVTTDDPDPSYLRISALDEFDGDAWQPSRRDLPPSQDVDGALPAPTGLGPDVATSLHQYELSATDALDSKWLPLPFPLAAAEAPGDWRYDVRTLDVTTTDTDLDTAGLEYTATAVRPEPTARDLLEAGAPPLTVSRDNVDLPFGEVPGWLLDLVDEVTAGAETDFEKAVALQRWFRDPDNFTYSTDRGTGNGVEDLEAFLTPGPDGRVGYCEQFASAMAVMARVADIPSRVAVGFLRPDPVLPGSWVFSVRDQHAWPELYFSGVGWVRFEPTPADQAPSVPSYTAGRLPELREEETAPTDAATAPTAERSLRPEALQGGAAEAAETGTTSRWWWAVPAVPLGVLLLLSPRLLRARVRSLRRAAARDGGVRAPEAAWDEVRATARDLGHGWDDAATLRSQERHLLRLLGRTPVAARAAGRQEPATVAEVHAAVARLTDAVERARFAVTWRPDAGGASPWDDALVVTSALLDRGRTAQRRRSTWWPSSLWAGFSPDRGLTPGGADGTGGPATPTPADSVRV